MDVPPISPPGGQPVQVPDEFFLRELLDLDMDGPEVGRVLSVYGSMHETARERFDLPGYFSTRQWDAIASYVQGEMEVDLVEIGSGGNDVEHLHAARGMVKCWIAEQEGQVREVLLDAWLSEGIDPRGEASPKELFLGVLNSGLRPFHVRATTDDDFAADLFSAVCLQLYNAIAEGIPLARCANEKCGRAFIRQRGRAQGPRRRLDAAYCSKRCARAQVQRDYHRRAKAKAKRRGGKR